MNKVYKDYFQKSRVFLYPVLEIPRGGSVTPIQSYISWKDNIKQEDCKLICHYYLRNDNEFLNIQKHKLFGSKYFDKFVEGPGDGQQKQGIFIFDMSDFKTSWDAFLKGKYSKLSAPLKQHIKNYYARSKFLPHVTSYLYPEKYYPFYSEILGVPISVLKESGELADVPNFTKEELTFTPEIIKLNTNQLITIL